MFLKKYHSGTYSTYINWHWFKYLTQFWYFGSHWRAPASRHLEVGYMFLAFSTFGFGKSMMLCHNDTNIVISSKSIFLFKQPIKSNFWQNVKYFMLFFIIQTCWNLSGHHFQKYLIKAELLQLKPQSLFAWEILLIKKVGNWKK